MGKIIVALVFFWASTSQASYWICSYKTKNAGLYFKAIDASKSAAKNTARNRCLSGSSEGMYNPSWCVFQGCQYR